MWLIKKGRKFQKQVFRTVATLTLGNGKETLGHWKRHQSQVGEKGEAQLIIKKKLKAPKLTEALAFFSPVKTTAGVNGEYQKKNPAETGAFQRVPGQQVWGPDAPFP